ncbi:putative Short-chain dehydrogenase [Spironucleus salmonicida]|uniref:Short-chain dehydrogenase n=1 Tax=Spironucleus salmonicida TaxID=348837 RepID=A0A9P8LZ98_9EUKA|nr:putative Short-chain dehydrogenase [Spironucleus salmonicida]KAH0577045.1 putative Short-chain dehydrogenase [Spironucleus salmonicida]
MITTTIYHFLFILMGALTIINRYLAQKRVSVKIVPGSLVLISGASSGLGRALAIALAKKGAKIHLLGRNLQELKNTQELCRDSLSHTVVQCDVSSQADVELLQTQHTDQKFDLVISCAGVGQSAKTATIAEVYALYAVNVAGAIGILQAVQSHAQLLISSPQAYLPIPNRCFYASSKAAISHYARCARMDGAKVYLASPGWFESGLRKNAIGGVGNSIKKGRTAEAVATSVIHGLERGVEETQLGIKERATRTLYALFGDIVQYAVGAFVAGKQ